MDAALETDARGRRHVANPCAAPCPIERGMRVLGGKWTGSILWHLRSGPVRFNDLCRLISGASKKMVAERLRHLEAHGLVCRAVQRTSPPSVHYTLTEAGHAALAALDSLRRWAEGLPGPEADAGPDAAPDLGPSAARPRPSVAGDPARE